MGTYERKRVKKYHKWIWIICMLLLIGFLALFIMPQVLYRSNVAQGTDDIAQSVATQGLAEESQLPGNEDVPVDEIVFPVSLDAGNIEIESLFQFSGVNPDAGSRKATDVASIVLRNTSSKYLSEATVNAMLGNGIELTFVVSEIPAGAAVMAFSVDNDSLLETDICTSITVNAVFADTSGMDGVEISVEGTTVTITNVSPEDLNEIDVYYRDVLSDKYFGGLAYSIDINHLSAGESTTFTAERSLLGVIDVVRVATNKKN